MKLKYLIFFFIINYSSSLIAQSIAIVDIQKLIDNNKVYVSKIIDLELNQQKYLEDFIKTEDDLKKKLQNIENSKLILNNDEINNQIDNYNYELNNFTLLVENFNSHYQNEIFKMREYLLSQIIILLEKYALQNNIDLILDSTSYLIASNSLDITDDINNELEKLNLDLEFKDFEKN